MTSAARSATVDPLIPLSLLEAVRDADRPEEATDTEYVPELLNKRLGTTETVYVQIRRYTDAVRRGQRIASPEVEGLARLIARRPDAGQVFQHAGETTARIAYERISAPVRGLVHLLPGFAARPLARRQVRKITARYFDAALGNNGSEFATYADAGVNELYALLSLN
jgi:hypothetical protein